MTRHTKLVADAVAAHHVARHARNVQRFAARVPLQNGGDFHRGCAFVFHAPQTQTGLQTQRDFGLHIGHFFLNQLIGSQWPAELLAVQGVLTRPVKTIFRRAQCAPGNAVTRTVQASERAFQALHFRECVFFGDKHAIHDDFASDGSTQTDLAVNRGCAQTRHAFFQHKAAYRTDSTSFADLFGPDHEHVCNRRIGDPHFVAAEFVAAFDLVRATGHAGRVRAVIGFGQTKATYPFAGGEFGQIFLPLAFGAEFKNRQHHQGRLHAHHGAITRVDPLDFACDQSIRHIVQFGAAVLRGDGGAEQAEFAHFTKYRRIGFFMPEGFGHARQQFVLAIRIRGFAHHALVFGELLVQQQGIVPMECGLGHECSGWLFV